jgi:hypothetical protein
VLQFKYQPGPLQVNEYESEKTWKEKVIDKYEKFSEIFAEEKPVLGRDLNWELCNYNTGLLHI